MKINKKFNSDLKNENIQNNQKKEKLKNFNQKFKTNNTFFFRSMFGVSNIRNLKRSGDIIISSTTKSEPIIISPLNSPRISVDSLRTPTPIIYNRSRSWYNKLYKDKIVWSYEQEDPIVTLDFKSIIKSKTKEANFLLEKNEIKKEQLVIFLKRLKALNISYVHTVVLDIISQNETEITFVYYIITTSDNLVDFGGRDKYLPKKLYYDSDKDINFFVAPVAFYRKSSQEEFSNMFKFKEKSEFKDLPELQKKITESLIRVEKEHGSFRLFDIDKDCLNKNIREIDPNEIFPIKEKAYKITNWVEHIFE